MIISYSSYGTRGTSNYPFKNKTAKILEGDRELTEQLIKNNKNKLKYRSGIISFEEKNPPKEVIDDVIKEFKRSTFAGLDREQYNLLMVEHTDTDNYHIHFYIPRVELTSGKSFNPHWHKEDQTRLLKLQDYLNAKHNLSNPFVLEKQTTLKNIDLKSKKDVVKRQIHEVITQQIQQGNIKNRNELIDFVKDSGLEVNRIGKNYITIKKDDEKVRLKGAYYAETFKDIRTVTEELERAEREHIPTSQRKFRELEQELDRLIQFKAKTNREKYPSEQQQNNKELELRTRDTKKKQDLQVHRNSINKLNNRNTSDFVFNAKSIQTARAVYIDIQGSKIFKNKLVGRETNTRRERQNNQVYKNWRVENDSFTTDVTRRTRERAEVQQRAYSKARQTRVELYKSITADAKELRAKLEQNSIELSEKYATVAKQSRELKRGAKEVTQESESSVRLSNKINRTTTARERITSTVRNFVERIKELRADIKNKFKLIIRQKENIDYREQQSYNKPARRLRL